MNPVYTRLDPARVSVRNSISTRSESPCAKQALPGAERRKRGTRPLRTLCAAAFKLTRQCRQRDSRHGRGMEGGGVDLGRHGVQREYEGRWPVQREVAAESARPGNKASALGPSGPAPPSHREAQGDAGAVGRQAPSPRSAAKSSGLRPAPGSAAGSCMIRVSREVRVIIWGPA